MTRPTELRVDHLIAPLGIGATAPRLSWKLPGGAAVQHAYGTRTPGRHQLGSRS
ncbi:MAG: hypothetical protein WKF93_10875 [Acidimicrobiales bacterium]